MGKWKRLRGELEEIQDGLQNVRSRLAKLRDNKEYPDSICDKAERIQSALGIDVDELGRMIGAAHKE